MTGGIMASTLSVFYCWEASSSMTSSASSTLSSSSPSPASALRSVDHRGGLDKFLAKAKDTDLSTNALKVKKEIAKAQAAQA